MNRNARLGIVAAGVAVGIISIIGWAALSSGIQNTSKRLISTTKEPEPYVNQVYDFQIMPPEGWKTEDNPKIGDVTPIVAFLGPRSDSFSPNINILLENTGYISIGEYAQLSKQGIYDAFALDNLRFISEQTLYNELGRRAFAFEFATTSDGETLRFKQVILMNGPEAYRVTFTALPDQYSTYVPLFDESVRTMKFMQEKEISTYTNSIDKTCRDDEIEIRGQCIVDGPMF